jgi:hypothetical protein
METPHVDAVGLVRYPEDYEAIPRELPVWKRLFAAVLLLFFFAVTVVTGAVTLGAYCLTSDGGDTRILQDSLRLWQGGE